MNRHLTDYSFPETSGNRKDPGRGVPLGDSLRVLHAPAPGYFQPPLPGVGVFLGLGKKKGHEVSFCARYGCARRGVRTYGLLCAVGIKRFIYGELQDSRGAEPATSINSPNTPIPTTNMMRSPMINISVRCVTESMRKPPCYWNYYRPGFDGLTYGVTPFSCR